uniref:BCL domain-containing protein n=2 Tax=Mesocestoides corti TaxID=53468 RepID=A0A5K3F294_MESCO
MSGISKMLDVCESSQVNCTGKDSGSWSSSSGYSSSSATLNVMRQTRSPSPPLFDQCPQSLPRTRLMKCLSEERDLASLKSMDALLREKSTRRTFQLLSSLVESRVPTDWIEPLLDYRQRSATKSSVMEEEPRDKDGDAGENRWQAMLRHNDEFHAMDILPDDLAGPRVQASPPPPPHSKINSAPVPDSISAETKAAAQKLINSFEKRYAEKFDSLVSDALRVYNGPVASTSSPSTSENDCETDLSSAIEQQRKSLNTARSQYMSILNSLFAQQINWGRIVAMLSFLRALCEVLESSRSSACGSSRAGSQQWNPSDRETSPESRQSSMEPQKTSQSPPRSHDQTDFVPAGVNLVPPVTPDFESDGPSPAADKLDRRVMHYLIWTTEFIHKESRLAEWIEAHDNWEGLIAFAASPEESLKSQFATILVGISAILLGPLGLAAALRFFLRRFWS